MAPLASVAITGVFPGGRLEEGAVVSCNADREKVYAPSPHPLPLAGGSWWERAGWWYILIGAAAISLFSMRYALPNPPFFIDRIRNHFLFPREMTLHAVGGSIALFVGPWQLLPSLRAAQPRVHRWLGRIYVAGVAVAFLLALVLMPTVSTGLPAASAFFLAGLIWISCAVLGVLSIRRGDIQAHRRWMLRSYAMAFAAVTIRIYGQPAKAFGVPFEYNYPASLWLAVLTNIVAVEAILRWTSMRTRPSDRPDHWTRPTPEPVQMGSMTGDEQGRRCAGGTGRASGR